MPPRRQNDASSSSAAAAAAAAVDDDDIFASSDVYSGDDDDPPRAEAPSDLVHYAKIASKFFEVHPWVLLLLVWCIAVPTHEKYPFSAGAVVASVALLYYGRSAARGQVLRSVLRFTLTKLPLYLAVGQCWAFVALYIGIWRRHLPDEIVKSVLACKRDSTCLFGVLPSLKNHIATYIVHWPFSVTMFLLRDPVFIALDFLWFHMRGIYVRVLAAATTIALGAEPPNSANV